MIKTFIRNFFKKVEETDTFIRQEEMIDGKAFKYQTYKFRNGSVRVNAHDTITATIDTNDENFSVTEKIGKEIELDTVVIFRAKEAFGMTECVGACFGKSK